ncbi:MAG: GerMN domain-containing protein [Acidobacteriota bacterium]|nr:GerMN domain-containing protein [Acidobacteriota bacterium]
MTRRAVAGVARLLPVLLITGAAAVVLVAALIAACGGRSQEQSPQPTTTVTVTATPSGTASGAASPSATAASGTTTLALYFLRSEKLGVADRRVGKTTMPATAAIRALLAGPSSAERAASLTTAIPRGTRLLGLSIDDGLARVDLSREFGSGGGSLSMAARVAQVVYTLTRFRTVRAVEFLMEGAPIEALGGEGVLLDAPQRRAQWRDLEPNIFVEAPGVGAVISSPFTLHGTARVFEGSFLARLMDSSGRRVVQVVMQASRGAPGRGRFTREVPFSTSASRGTLIVFDRSMEDGSRQDEVQIPVLFAD